jgi:hypothetical protein
MYRVFSQNRKKTFRASRCAYAKDKGTPQRHWQHAEGKSYAKIFRSHFIIHYGMTSPLPAKGRAAAYAAIVSPKTAFFGETADINQPQADL